MRKSIEPIDPIGMNIRNIRLQNNYTVNDLSKLSGLSVTCIIGIEKSLIWPTFDELEAIANALNVTTLQLKED